MILIPTFLLLFLALCVTAQSCENYGVVNGSSCSCPPGFGGSTCSQPACGGNIFQGSQRPLTPPSSGSSFSNLTASGCSCQSGWTGTGCNVCQVQGVCQSAYSNAGGPSSSSSSLGGVGDDGQNNTLTCNTSPRVFAASEMSCQVINPTLQAIYPLNSTLTILRTLQPSLTPLPNTTAFGPAGSVFAQLFYAGVEQFSCRADSCTQSLNDTGAGSTSWSCSNLQCSCRAGTTFCGGVPVSNLTTVINGLVGTLGIACGAPDNSTGQAQCDFKQQVLQQLFGAQGLSLSGCSFGECVRQSVIDTGGNGTTASDGSQGAHGLSGGVIAGLAVVGALVLLALLGLAFGYIRQRKARKGTASLVRQRGAGIEWSDISYTVAADKTVLDSVSGHVDTGTIMAVLGPSGAGKTSLVEILAGRAKVGRVSGSVAFTRAEGAPRVGFVPQQDVLPPALTVREALTFAARLRLPEPAEKKFVVEEVMEQLGLAPLADARIGQGLSGGERRRVSIGLELVARPDVLVLDEPTSGLDSVSAARIARVLHALAHDSAHPTAVLASIHQPSSALYHTFDTVLLLSHGRALYSGPGGTAPARHFADAGVGAPGEGYNVADWLLEVASDPPVGMFGARSSASPSANGNASGEKVGDGDAQPSMARREHGGYVRDKTQTGYEATFLTQLEVLCGREWKILRRDKTLFFTHLAVACVLGVFCGGLYYQTDTTIAGFQSRVGCLFFLGALIAFSSLSALYNLVEVRPLFVRERAASYYSPTAWLLARLFFDVLPLRIIPTIIVSTITYWMAGLAGDAAHFFKFLFILVLYTLAMTLFNFLLATLFQNGGIAILLSALSALYQMTFAGFFVHLNSIPPVLRWLQWLCPLKYTLEALAVNEVGSGLMIQDTLQGVPVDVSASLIMNLLFGFGANNYYRDVLVLFAYIAGFAVGVIGVVWLKVRERR